MQFVLISCNSSPSNSVDSLTPYKRPTLAPTSTLVAGRTNTPQPTATPAVYVIQQNDTLISIAKRLGITVEALIQANPDVVPSALTVGQQLLLPGDQSRQGIALLPTPVALSMGQPFCDTQPDGIECSVDVENPSQSPVENILVRFHLFAADGSEVGAMEGVLLLNQLQPGQTLPATAFFPGASGQASVEAFLVSANPAPASTLEGLSKLTDIQQSISWDGKTATVRGLVANPAGFTTPRNIWVAIIGQDGTGATVAYRRWEWRGTLPENASLPFELSMASLRGEIATVQVYLEEWPEP